MGVAKLAVSPYLHFFYAKLINPWLLLINPVNLSLHQENISAFPKSHISFKIVLDFPNPAETA